MRQVQISREHRAAHARRHQDDDQVLPTELRDPDIVRAKQLMKGDRFRIPTGRGKTTT
jgi:hypothetical protein